MGVDNLHTRTEVQTRRPELRYILPLLLPTTESTAHGMSNGQWPMVNELPAKGFGQLVVLGFDVAVFTPAPYQRHRL